MHIPLLSCLIVVTLVAGAATPAAAQVAGGVKGGLLLADFRTTSDDGETALLGYRPDFIVGGFLLVPAEAPLVAQVEAMLARRGPRLEVGDERVDFNLTYLDVSGFVRGTVSDGSSADVYLFGGPTLGFRLSARRVHFEAGEVVDDMDISDGIRSMDVRVTGGIGVEIDWLLLEARFTHGLRDIRQEPDLETIQNRGIEVLVGYRF
jgi:hypothetical protein